MKNKIFFGTLVFSCILISFAAGAENIALVNGKPISSLRVEIFSGLVAASGQSNSTEMNNELIEEIVLREVLTQEAVRRGLDAGEIYKNRLELARQAILIPALYQAYSKTNPISEEEIKLEYEKNEATVDKKQYKVRHILVETEQQAKDLLLQLKSGSRFEDVARAMSQDKGSASIGGDLDWSLPSNFVSDFSRKMLELAKGEIASNPVKTPYGWHIIRLDDVRQVPRPTLDEVRWKLIPELQQQRLKEFTDDLRKKARVE
jgi:peptidyl-prolyl cis-trans isomerase C